MDDELRQAAEQVVAAYEEMNRRLPLAGGIPQPIETSTDKAVMLARAYLAEHPADEGEPVTEDWLRLGGWELMDSLSSWWWHRISAGVTLHWHDHGVELLVGSSATGWHRVTEHATRGHVRRLLAALGVTP